MSTKEILIEAKRLLIEVGWFQGAYHKLVGKEGTIVAHCSLGAIFQASRNLNANNAAGAIGAIGNAMENDIPRWNDAKGRTKEEVLEAFDKAIASL